MVLTVTQKIRVLTYNIHKGFSPLNINFILNEIRENIRTLDADVVFIQEIQGEHLKKQQKISNWEENQMEFLADEVWPHFAYAKNAVYNSGHHGSAILSRYPIIGWENINVSTWSKASRSILHATIKVQESAPPLHLMCVHFDFIWMEAKRQLQELVERVNSHAGHDEPLIVAGDFNDWRRRVSRILENEGALREASRTVNGTYAKTFPAWLPVLSLDRIYYRNLIPVSCQTAPPPQFNRLSDHLPLVAEFSIPN